MDDFSRLPDGGEGLLNAVRSLRQASQRLRMTGLLIAMLTGVAIAILTYIMVNFGRRSYLFPDPFILLSIFTASNLALIVFRDSIRRVGESLFEEISDELQWFVAGQLSPSKNDSPPSRPPLEIRYALRRFARDTDLPLVSGSTGPAAYAAINLALFFAAAYFSYISGR